MARVRVDQLLVERQLVASRERARALILAGQVRVNGQPVTKAGTAVDADAAVELIDSRSSVCRPRRSQAGACARHLRDRRRADAKALDIGASTGGFTDVLLQRGAARVVALDVGHGQLDWKLRTDPRVVVIEHFNARQLTAGRSSPRPLTSSIIDVSFISLRHILPVVPPVLTAGGDVSPWSSRSSKPAAPRFSDGVITDPQVHARVVDEVTACRG